MSNTHKKKLYKKACYMTGLIFVSIIILLVYSFLKDIRQNDVQESSIPWLKAVTYGKADSALKLANLICPNIPSRKQPQQIIDLFEKQGISRKFINAKYNKWDFIYWENALFFFSLAKSLTSNINNKNDDKIINVLFNAVHSRIKPVAIPKQYIPWACTAWKIKKGLCDKQSWTLAELAYQLGFETQIVYLNDLKTKNSPHTICEIRKGNKVWTADPLSGIILKDISVSQLSNNPNLKEKIWPKNPNWQTAINTPTFYTPAHPQAYAPRNQQLYTKLKSALKEYCPRFGEAPSERQRKYLVLTGKTKNKFTYKFWFFPFRLLHASMVLSQ